MQTTHLLGMGLDIVTLKNLLGHSDINTTLGYLHIAQLGHDILIYTKIKFSY